jgi:ABC-type cobalt transport system substrate-binding protein
MKPFVSSLSSLPPFQSTTVLILCAVLLVTVSAQAGVGGIDTRAKAAQTELATNYGAVPLAFEPNQGQAEDGVSRHGPRD